MMIKNLSRLLLPAGAGIVLLETLVLAWNDRVSAATLTAGLFCVLVLFHYFPQLESFKAFTIEAKLRQTLGEADRVVANLRRLAHLAAREMLYQSAMQGRFGGDDFKAKAKLADEVSSLLKDLDFDEATFRQANYPLLGILAHDLMRPLRDMANKRLQLVHSKLQAKKEEIFPGNFVDLNSPRYQEWLDLVEKTNKLRVYDYKFGDIKADPTPEMFETECQAMIEQSYLPIEDQQKLHEFNREIQVLYRASYKAGNITDEAADLLMTRANYENDNKLYEEFFPSSNV